MAEVGPYLAAILPTILVATLFYFLIKTMIEGDRRERLAQRQFEAEQDRGRKPVAGPAQPAEPPSGQAGMPPVDSAGEPRGNSSTEA